MGNEFGNNIKKIRKKLRLTQAQLAKLINKSLSSVQKYEAGEVSIPIEVVEAMTRKLKVSSTEIIGGLETVKRMTDSMEKFLTAVGFDVFEVFVYTGDPEKEQIDFEADNFECIVKISKNKQFYQLSKDEVYSLMRETSDYIEFLLYKANQEKKIGNHKELTQVDISALMSKEMIEHIKNKLKLGEECLTDLEEKLWELHTTLLFDVD